VQRNKRKRFNKGHIIVGGAAQRDPGRERIKSRSEGSMEVGQMWLILGGEQRKPRCDGDLLGLSLVLVLAKLVKNLSSSCGPGRSLPLIFCIHVRSGPIYWGVYLPCKKKNKVMVFYL
jgi:hypothetical protein